MIVFLLICIGIAVLAAYIGMLAEQGFDFIFNKIIFKKHLIFSGIIMTILYLISVIIFLKQIQY